MRGTEASSGVKGPRDGYERILALLNEAALGDARWPEVENLISETAGTKGSGVLIFGGRSQVDGVAFLARLSLRGQRRADWERRYFEEYFLRDERVPRVLRLDHGEPVHTGELYTDVEKKRSPTYNEALPDTRARDGLHIRLNGPEGLHVVWGVCDSTEKGGWGGDQIRLIRRLGPHVAQFALVRHALIEAEVTGSSAPALLDSTRFGVIQIDRSGRILTANDRAVRILRKGDGLLDRDGFLRARVPTENAVLSRLLDSALPHFGDPCSAGSMMISRSSSSSPSLPRLALHITPVGDEYPHFRTRRIGALILLVDPASGARIDAVHVATGLGLTPAGASWRWPWQPEKRSRRSPRRRGARKRPYAGT